MYVDGIADEHMVGKFYQINDEQIIDLATEDPSVGQVRIEGIVEGGKKVEITLVPFTGLPAGAYEDKWIQSFTATENP
jgi:hypothetical protein